MRLRIGPVRAIEFPAASHDGRDETLWLKKGLICLREENPDGSGRIADESR